MKFTTLSGTVALSAVGAMAKEMPKNEAKAAELYDSGVVHSQLMQKKKAFWKAEEEAGLLDSSQWPRLNYTKCVDGIAQAIEGSATHKFRCKNMDLYDFINHETLGSPNSRDGKVGSSSWGWTDPKSDREFIATGMYDGVGFLEILPEGRFHHLGFLPKFADVLTDDAYWTEIRSYKNYMIIGSELDGNGVQIFDMTKLLDITADEAPVQFHKFDDLTGHWNETLPLGSMHNVVVNEEAQYGVSVGARPRTEGCLSGLQFFSLDDPSNPETLGCASQDGYVHDAQCLIYRGPHEKYVGRDICYGYNEDTLTIYDVTDKQNTEVISRTSYVGVAYTHQGWVDDVDNQQWLFMDDEFDEDELVGPAADGYPVTYIWDIRDLENPKQTGLFKAADKAIDHNLYVIDGLMYQSNYGAGVRVYDVSSVPEDPTGDSVCEVAYFDIHPEDDDLPGGGSVEFTGSWSSYGYFKSGYVFVNTIERGAFLVKKTKSEKCKPKSCNADNCLRALRASHIDGRLEESQEFCADFLDGWNAEPTAVPDYATEMCQENVISRVSSACSCLPTPTATP